MSYENFVEYLSTKSVWVRKWATSIEDSIWEDWEYERSYADCIYDELTIWSESGKVSVLYHDIGWGYTNCESYEFTYEEFISWWESKG